MQRPCPISLTGCPGVDSPITNISAEAPDPLVFWGQIWNPYDPYRPPRLGNGLDVMTDCDDVFHDIFSIYDPIVYAGSQLMANLHALAIQLGCPWPPNPPGQIFENDAQTATVYCPDGASFTYTVEAGTIVSPELDDVLGAAWLAWANAWAASYALEQASALRTCIVNIPTGGDQPDNPPGDNPPTPHIPPSGGLLPNSVWMCSGEELNRTYQISGSSSTAFSITIVDGSIPPGTTFTQTEPRKAIVSGFPDVPGEYEFKLRAVSIAAPLIVSEVWAAIFVFGITNADSIPSAEIGVPYSQTLVGAGGTSPYTFSLDVGSVLPNGLSLSTNGIISGTPTDIGDFSFFVVITDANGGECTGECFLSTFQGCTADTNCNPPQQAPCVFPTSITFTDWNARKTGLVAPTADPALGQPEWDGTLPVADDVDFPGIVRWYPAGTVFPVVVGLSFNDLLGFPGGIRLDVSGGSWRLVMYGYVGGVPTLIWQGNKTAGVTPEGTYMRVGGLSAGPDCMHATVTSTSGAIAWWTMDGPNPLINTDSACGLQLTVPSGVLPDYSIVAGHVVNATQINCGSSVPGSVTDDLLECSNAALKFNGVGTTICGWINVSDTVPDVDNGVIVDYLFDQNGVPYEIRIERHGSGANWIASINGLGSIAIASAAGWHFLVVTFDAITGNLGFDIDQSGMTNVFAVIPSVGANVNGDFIISTHTEVGKVVNVIFDELAIFDGVLTNAQLNCIYNGGVGKTW